MTPTIFLSIDEGEELGIFIGYDQGAAFVSLQEFIDESKIDLSSTLRQRYACAFEVMAKQLREGT